MAEVTKDQIRRLEVPRPCDVCEGDEVAEWECMVNGLTYALGKECARTMSDMNGDNELFFAPCFSNEEGDEDVDIDIEPIEIDDHPPEGPYSGEEDVDIEPIELGGPPDVPEDYAAIQDLLMTISEEL